MNNQEAQNELCRSTKTPEKVHKITLSYERGDKYAKSFVSIATGGGILSIRSGGGIKIKQEPVGIIRGGYRNFPPRGRGSFVFWTRICKRRRISAGMQKVLQLRPAKVYPGTHE